jgi:aryl sulfotransferase
MRPLPLDRILGGLEWEQDGPPYWSHLRTVQSWFEWRHLPNILLLHYADMKADTPAAIARIAAYLGLDRTDEQLADVLERTGCVRRASST